MVGPLRQAPRLGPAQQKPDNPAPGPEGQRARRRPGPRTPACPLRSRVTTVRPRAGGRVARRGAAKKRGGAVGPARVVTERTAAGELGVGVGSGGWSFSPVRRAGGAAARAGAARAAPAAVAERARPPVRAPAPNERPVAVGARGRAIEPGPATGHRAVASPEGQVAPVTVVGEPARAAPLASRPLVAAVSPLGAEGRATGTRAAVPVPAPAVVRETLGPVPVAGAPAPLGTAAVGAPSKPRKVEVALSGFEFSGERGGRAGDTARHRATAKAPRMAHRAGA